MKDKRDPKTSIDVRKAVNSIHRLEKLKELNVDELIEMSHELGKEWKNENISTSQIRKVFSEIKRMEMDFQAGKFDLERVKLLRPQLAYMAGRKKELRGFKELMDAFIVKIKDREDFFWMARFVESILAYHKFYGGRE
ncbi:MAG: type III-A CRISPR-associated protein Csm2 [Candidatus Geothermincolales bacterium]